MVTTYSKQTFVLSATAKYYIHVFRVHFKVKAKLATTQMFHNPFAGVMRTAASVDNIVNQVDEGVPHMVEAARELTQASVAAREVLNKVNEVMTPVSEASVAARDVLDKVNTAMTPLEIKWDGANLVPSLVKVARIVANLAMAREGCRIASLLLNISSEFGSEILETIKGFLFTKEAVVRTAQTQGIEVNLDDVTSLGSVQTWIASNAKLTVTTLAVAIFGLLQVALGLPAKSIGTEGMLKFFGDRLRNMRSIAEFGMKCSGLFTDFATWIINSIFPGAIPVGLDEYLEGYAAWSKSVLDLVDPNNPVCERVKKDKRLVFQISALYKKGMQYSTNINALKIDGDLRDHFQKTFRLCEGFLREADHSGVLGNTARVKPYMMHFFGESGVGKSGMLWPLASDLNAAVAGSYKEAQDPAGEIYFRNPEQQFWDSYAGQNVCVWDDFGQLTDTTACPNPEFFEIIRAGNPAPYPLHMATLEEKARTKFISKFCILTSNKINLKVNSITFPAAMRRRIDFLAKVTIKPEYAKDGVDLETQQVVQRLDVSKCKGGVDTEPYIFTVYNPESLQPLMKDGAEWKMDYEEMVAWNLSQASVSFAASMDFNEKMTERMDTKRFARMRELLHGNHEPAPAFPSAKPATTQILGGEDDAFLSALDNVSADELNEVFSGRPMEAPTVPVLTKGMMVQWKNKLKGWFKLKPIILAAGAILSLVGVWGLFKYFKDDEEATLEFPVPEGFSSENGTKTKQLVSELGISGDSKTAHLKKAAVEGAGEDLRRLSKALSRALRHQIITKDGWVLVSDLVDHLKGHGANALILLCCADNDEKGRFEVRGRGDTLAMRATQGHSYPIAPELIWKRSDITVASHFTYSTRIESMKKTGILSMGRTAVHLHPGHLVAPPKDLPNRNVVVWLDLKGLEVWETQNGYLMVMDSIPPSAIVQTRTMKPKTKIVSEASVSGDSRTKKLPVVVTEVSDATTEAWKDKSAQELISHRILGNLYRIYVDGKLKLNGLFVRDTVMLTVQHLLPCLRSGKMIRIENMYGAAFEVPIQELKISVIVDSAGDHKDAMLIQFPRHVNAHSDLVKHFQKMPELAIRKVDISLPCMRELDGKRLFTILGNTQCSMEHAEIVLDGKKVRIRNTLQYALNTTAGDCGAPVIVNDTSFSRKIAGIHIAAFDDGSASIGQSVTQADLLKFMANFETIEVDHDDLPNVGTKSASLQLMKEYTTPEILEHFDMPAETFGYIGQCTKVSSPPAQTDLRESAIHGFVEPTTKPAFLRHGGVNLVHKNMEKCAINCPHIPQEEVERAVNEVKTLLISGSSRSRLARVLTYEEAVAGSPLSEYIDGIKRGSSPGYPHVFHKKPDFPGKTTWFGKDEWEFSEEIRQLVEERIQWAKEGRRYPTVWSDTLKDERRPIEKVNQLKTRVFSHGPMDYTIAFRMYFLGFIAHIMENRIANEQSLGTNPFGVDWLLTARKLQKKGKRVFAGDFSQFDGTLNSCIMKEFAKVANEFYNDGEENARIREVFMVEIYNSIHLCSGKFIQLTHSQPSGNPLTTVLNSFYNSVSMRIAYYRCFSGKAPAFMENVSMVSYGDDNVVNFSEEVATEFNQNTVTKAYATFGMTYTDEAKTFGEIADWRDLTEVNYLKRGFKPEEGQWRAPLDENTILESCNWIRKCPDAIGACIMNCEAACREFAQFPVEIFERRVRQIKEAVLDKTHQCILVKTRRDYLDDESPAW